MRTNQLVLPEAKSISAEEVIKNCDKLRQFIPATIDEQQFMASLVAECNKLHEVNRSSVLIAAMNACVIGLVLGPALGHAYLVPFKKDGAPQATLIVGYRGFLKLAFDNNFLATVESEYVLRGEVVEVYHDETGRHFRHDMPPVYERDEGTRENVVGAYCTWKTRLGGHGSRFIRREEIDKADRGKSSNTPWKTHYSEMVRKMPIARAAKLWDVTRRMAEAVQITEEEERGVDQSPLRIIDGDATPDAASVIGNLKAILRDKAGTTTPEDELMVVAWAIGRDLSGEDYVDLDGMPPAVESLTRAAAREATDKLMTWHNDHGGEWSDALDNARRRAEVIDA